MTEPKDLYNAEDLNFSRVVSFNTIGSKTLINYIGRTPMDMGLFLFDAEKGAGHFLDRQKIRAFRTNITVVNDHFLVCNLSGGHAPMFYQIDQSGKLISTLRIANYESWKPGFKLEQAFNYDDQTMLINFTDQAREGQVIAATFQPFTGELKEVMTLKAEETFAPVIMALKQRLIIANKFTAQVYQESNKNKHEILRGYPVVETKKASGSPIGTKKTSEYRNQLYGFHPVGETIQFEFAAHWDASGQQVASPEKYILTLEDQKVAKAKKLVFYQGEANKFYWDYPEGDMHLQ